MMGTAGASTGTRRSNRPARRPRVRRRGWASRIAAAKRRGHFTKQDHHDAARWNLCAVGESLRYPKTEEWALRQPLSDFKIVPPVVSHQDNAAIQFVCAVEQNDFDAAGLILAHIKAEASGRGSPVTLKAKRPT